MYKEPVHRVPRELRTDGWIEVVSRAGAGGVPSLDHPESDLCVESRTRHEIFVFGFDYTQKIGVQGGHAPRPHPARGAGPSNSLRPAAWIDRFRWLHGRRWGACPSWTTLSCIRVWSLEPATRLSCSASTTRRR